MSEHQNTSNHSRKRFRVVGVTGGIGSGKSTIARKFQKLGVHTVDADDVAREVVEPGTEALAAIAAHFGANILTDGGRLDRPALRRKIFDDAGEREWLEALLHPLIREEIRRQLWIDDPDSAPADYALRYVILVSPLLLETDQKQLTDTILLVDVPVETQITRVTERDRNERAQVERIIAAQLSRDDKLRLADIVIDNDRLSDAVIKDIYGLHERFNAGPA